MIVSGCKIDLFLGLMPIAVTLSLAGDPCADILAAPLAEKVAQSKQVVNQPVRAAGGREVGTGDAIYGVEFSPVLV
jgi:hypothetical protein